VIHELIKTWFLWVEQWGYLGVFILMAMESSIFPVPSEIVIPPAAYWASQGRMDFGLVILAGTLGSLFGSVVTYGVSAILGTRFVNHYGKFVLLGPDKIDFAQKWVSDYGTKGIFIARLLPVVRHLISIPAGILKMNFKSFCIVTTLGSLIWCSILAWFGRQVIGDRPELLQNPDELIFVLKHKLIWFVGAVVVLGVLLAFVQIKKKRALIKINDTPGN
jgi:membrane protein DedA with SNARE-associated domain